MPVETETGCGDTIVPCDNGRHTTSYELAQLEIIGKTPTIDPGCAISLSSLNG